jgi:hypothetical protein
MFFMIGCVLGPLSGISVFASDEKADWNCLFKILAFSVGSACKTPSLLRGYKEAKSKLQKEMRNSYWNYIENMIFDLDINEPDQQKFNKQPKNVYICMVPIKWNLPCFH